MKFIHLISIIFLVSCVSKQKVSNQWKAQNTLQELGLHLYFDKRLSADNSVSCNTCHNVANGAAGHDGLRVSNGIKGQKGERNSPTVWNSKFLSVQFWDGRAKDLTAQAKGPILNPGEMGMPNENVVMEKLKKVPAYVELFKKAFPDEKEPMTYHNLATAIAAFEETLVDYNSPYDKWKAGDKAAMSIEAIEGYQTFQAAGCVACHQGDNFSGPSLPVGTGFYMKFPSYPSPEIEKKYRIKDDKGRYEVTKKKSDEWMFRVPTLRNVARTSPYFHNGRVETLEEAIRVMGKTQLNKDLSEKEVASIAAFLKALNGDLPMIQEPKSL